MSDSVIIEPVSKADDAGFHRLVGREKGRLLPYFPVTVGRCTDVGATRRYLKELVASAKEGSYFCFVLRDYEGSDPIGALFLKQFDRTVGRCEVAYFIGEAHSGQGYGTLGVMWAVDHAFSRLGMSKVVARIAPDNTASIRVAEHCGFQREGLLRCEFRTGTGELVDLLYYGNLRA
ncbi:MAG: GNAT family N-acetyltransferase [Flavobacteriales bacterium]|nr:GNAT family N-acetyltransferase [Flavobacteriales bacterium]